MTIDKAPIAASTLQDSLPALGGPGTERLASRLSGHDPQRIALLHLDSLCCLPALDDLFAALDSRIGLVVSSQRFGGLAGFHRQLRRNLKHSGLRMTLALGFDIVALRIAAVFAPIMRWCHPQWLRNSDGTAGHPLRTLKEHATRVGAHYDAVSNINGPATLELLRRFHPDLIVSFHFDQILREPLLGSIACPIINVHPALLPAHRGPCPSFWVLAAGDARCGVTIHRIIDETIDAGPILSRRERPLPSGICMAELDELLFRDGVEALLSLLTSAEAGPATEPRDQTAYEPFPHRSVVRQARLRGVRLWRLAHAGGLIAALFGWAGPARKV